MLTIVLLVAVDLLSTVFCLPEIRGGIRILVTINAPLPMTGAVPYRSEMTAKTSVNSHQQGGKPSIRLSTVFSSYPR